MMKVLKLIAACIVIVICQFMLVSFCYGCVDTAY